MRKPYQAAAVRILWADAADVIATSGNTIPANKNSDRTEWDIRPKTDS